MASRIVSPSLGSVLAPGPFVWNTTIRKAANMRLTGLLDTRLVRPPRPACDVDSLNHTTVSSVSVDTNVTQIGAVTGDSERQLSLRVTVDPSSVCDNQQGCKLMLSWSGHISSAVDWGNGNAAGDISGASYHMRVKGVDQENGDTGGNQDRSVQLGDTGVI